MNVSNSPEITEPFARPIRWMVRIGYGARGLVFLIIGGVAFLAAESLGRHPVGARDALELIFQKPFGAPFPERHA